MPELTEVELTRRKLAPLLVGRRITGFSTAWPRGVRALGVRSIVKDIVGRRIRSLSRRGKVLFIEFSGHPTRMLALHLRMSGRLAIAGGYEVSRFNFVRSDKVEADEERWIRHRILLSSRRELRFIDPRKFGLVWYGSPAAFTRDSYLGSLGEDAAGIGRERFIELFHNHRGMTKAFLLGQRRISGIGNIIADESLWRARIHPRRDVATLTRADLLRLHRALGVTLKAMLASGGTTLRDFRHPDGEAGRYQKRRLVYGRAGLPCPRCRRLLTRLVVAGRGTTVCEVCQPRH